MTALNPVMRVGEQIAEVLSLHLGWIKNRHGRALSNFWTKPASTSPSKKPKPTLSNFPAANANAP